MKLLLIILLLLGAGSGIIIYIMPQSSVYQESVLVIDKTDILNPPDAYSTFIQSEIQVHKWHSIKIRVTTISEFALNKVYETYLPESNPLFSNPHQRDKDIQIFEQQTKACTDSINAQPSIRKQSAVYQVLVKLLKELAASTAKKKDLYVHSDLGQNTKQWSIYNKDDYRECIKHPQAVQEMFQKMEMLPNLQGIYIHIIFQPRNMEEADRFSVMAKVFEQMFIAAGAKVSITVNFNGNE